MESITIVREDGLVYKNGEPRKVGLSSLPEDIHAVQWRACEKRGKCKGWIEYVQDELEDHRPNEEIDSIAPFQKFIDAWESAPTLDEVMEVEAAENSVKELQDLLKKSQDKLHQARAKIGNAG